MEERAGEQVTPCVHFFSNRSTATLMAGSPEGNSLSFNSIQDCSVEFQNEKTFFPVGKQWAPESSMRGLAGCPGAQPAGPVGVLQAGPRAPATHLRGRGTADGLQGQASAGHSVKWAA